MAEPARLPELHLPLPACPRDASRQEVDPAEG